MARIQMGVIVTDIRGKLGGNQFSKTRAGNILQRKCGQRRGATRAQSNKRAVFSQYARYWRSLSDSDRLANNTNTTSYPVIDKFGNTVYLSGYQLLLRSNINRIAIGETPIQVVPGTPPDGASIGFIVLSLTSNGSVIEEALLEWDNPTGDYENKVLMLYVSPGVSPGISVYNGRFILYEFPIDPEDQAFDFTQIYTLGNVAQPNIGDRTFVRVDMVDIATGIVVNSYSTSALVETF